MVIAMTAVINFVNFTDGLDGLVAGCMAISLAAVALDGASGLWPLVGALAGFLIWNWAQPKCSWERWAAPLLVPSSLEWCCRPAVSRERFHLV